MSDPAECFDKTLVPLLLRAPRAGFYGAPMLRLGCRISLESSGFAVSAVGNRVGLVPPLTASGLPPTADITPRDHQFRKVPIGDIRSLIRRARRQLLEL